KSKTSNLRRGAIGGRKCNKNGPNRLLVRAAAGSRNAGRGQGEGSVRLLPCAFSHYFRHAFTHGTVACNEAWIDAQHSFLGVVGISNVSGQEDSGGAWHVRDSMGEKTAGAGFRHRQRLLPLREKLH